MSVLPEFTTPSPQAGSGAPGRHRVAMLSALCVPHTQRWAAALAERGHQVDLICLRSHTVLPDPAGQPIACQVPDGVTLHTLPFTPPLGYYANASRLRRLLRALQPDLLHAHYASGYGTLARLCGFHPFVLSLWGTDIFAFPDRSRWNRRLVVCNLLAADRVCSTSHVMARRAREICPTLREPSITPFGIDLQLFQPRPDAKEFGQTTTIGTVKTLSSGYGIDVLIRAFARTYHELGNMGNPLGRQLRLLIVGGGPDMNTLKRLAHEQGIESVTEFAGRVDHAGVPEQLRRLDVYLALSRTRESFGVAVLEASACGLPVIVSNRGGLPEVVRNGETGLVVESENVEAAAAAIRQLVTDAVLRRRLGEAGRAHVVANYDWRESVSIIEGVYSGVLNGTNGRGST